MAESKIQTISVAEELEAVETRIKLIDKEMIV